MMAIRYVLTPIIPPSTLSWALKEIMKAPPNRTAAGWSYADDSDMRTAPGLSLNSNKADPAPPGATKMALFVLA